MSPLTEELARRAGAIRDGQVIEARPGIAGTVLDHAARIALAEARHDELMGILRDAVAGLSGAAPAEPRRPRLRVVRDGDTA